MAEIITLAIIWAFLGLILLARGAVYRDYAVFGVGLVVIALLGVSCVIASI